METQHDFNGIDVRTAKDLNASLNKIELRGDTAEDMRLYTGTASQRIDGALSGRTTGRSEIDSISVGPKQIAIKVSYAEGKPYPEESAAFVKQVVAQLETPFDIEVVVDTYGSDAFKKLAAFNEM